MISNDPSTPQNILCYFLDKSVNPNLGYVQFPARFHGINKRDTYGSEMKRMYQINPEGMNGLAGPDYFGTGTFFNRRAFYGGPSSMIGPIDPDHLVKNHINDQAILELAHDVTTCDYEKDTNWGSEVRSSSLNLTQNIYFLRPRLSVSTIFFVHSQLSVTFTFYYIW